MGSANRLGGWKSRYLRSGLAEYGSGRLRDCLVCGHQEQGHSDRALNGVLTCLLAY